MEMIYFFIGAVTVAVLFTVGWLFKIVQMQIKQIKNLEQDIQAIVSNDITEGDVRGIVDSRVDKFAANVEKDITELKSNIDREFNDVYTSVTQNVEMLIRGDEQLKRDLIEQINANRVGNRRNVTNGDLQNEY
jgi:hypothetical protein